MEKHRHRSPRSLTGDGHRDFTGPSSAATAWTHSRPRSMTPPAGLTGGPRLLRAGSGERRTGTLAIPDYATLNLGPPFSPVKPDHPNQTTTSGVIMTGSSTEGIKTVLHPVSDLAK